LPSTDASPREIPEGGTEEDAATGSDAEAGTNPADGSSDATLSDGGSDADAADATLPPPYASAALATGLAFGCRIDPATAVVWCWGDNQFGQTTGPIPPAVDDGGPHQVALPNDAGAVALALGDYHACALSPGGSVYCWGRDDANQLNHAAAGIRDNKCDVQGVNYACNPGPLAATTGIAAPVFLSAAGPQTCAATSGAVQCWGQTAEAGTPDASFGGIAQLVVGSDHSCVLLAPDAGAAGSTNSAQCWGGNAEDQLTPFECPGNSDVCPVTSLAIPEPAAVAVGSGFTCAIPADGGVVCFGDNANGELGHAVGSAGDLPLGDAGVVFFNGTPIQVAGAVGTGPVGALVASGNGQAACALVNGSVTCWGGGTGTPFSIGGLPSSMIALGAPDGAYVCGEASDGGIWCWTVAAGATATQVH